MDLNENLKSEADVTIPDLTSLEKVEVHKQQKYNIIHKFFAEFFGTTCLVFYNCTIGPLANSAGDRSVSKIFGTIGGSFIVTSLIYIVGKISGAHFNPAVSIPMCIRKKIGPFELVIYLIAQILGSIIGCFFVVLCRRGNFSELGSTTIGVAIRNSESEIDVWSYVSAFMCETIITFFLVMTVFATCEQNNNTKNLTGIIVGITLTINCFVGAYVSGASMNPARSFAPAIFEAISPKGSKDAIKQIWIYILAPIFGGVIAAFVSNLLFN